MLWKPGGEATPAKDRYHDAAKRSLVKAGWTVTHDPLFLRHGKKDMFVDLGAQQLIGAEKETRKIAIEVKSFVSNSDMDDLEKALGQFIIYHDVLRIFEPERILYLAVSGKIAQQVFEQDVGKLMLDNQRLRLMVFDEVQEEILEWIP
ncbi:MAG: XisH family protein [Acidobacteriota bacterium]